jgi:DNA anti-recombination protein RmuC
MKDIAEQLTGLKKDFDKLSSSWRTLNKSIVRLGKQSESVDDRVGRITTRFRDIHELDFLSESDGAADKEP